MLDESLDGNRSSSLNVVTRRLFHPEEERVTDHDEADWAFRLGYEPQEMAQLFQQMQQREAR